MAKVVNFGCRLNALESDYIKSILNKDDVIIINTCAVTNEAERQSRQTIRKEKKNNPDKKIIVVGCAVQGNHKQFSEMPEVDKIIGNGDKMLFDSYEKDEKIIVNNDIQNINSLVLSQDRSGAFVQIQNGCNHRCSFCIVPLIRGKSKSMSITNIINSINILIENGYKEVVLTGIDITEYGKDLPGEPTLGNLCKRIFNLTSLQRLRLSSLDVAEIDNDLLDLIKNEPKLMPYFHISMQSGDDEILRKMNRRHNVVDFVKFHNFVMKYRNDSGIGMDIICGFPSETDENFNNTKKLMSNFEIPYVHAFTYSPKKGTMAAKMQQIDLNLRKKRTKELIEIGNGNLLNFMKKMINIEQDILMEKNSFGKTNNFANIKILQKDIPDKSLIKAKVIGIEDFCLIGDIL